MTKKSAEDLSPESIESKPESIKTQIRIKEKNLRKLYNLLLKWNISEKNMILFQTTLIKK
ncbi:MAG: hypothetical protein ACFFAN_10965 [Promethearchaeota archaeon]